MVRKNIVNTSNLYFKATHFLHFLKDQLAKNRS